MVCLAVVGCAAAEGAPADPPEARFAHGVVVRMHMHENFDLLRAIEKLLLRGKLDDATALGRAIADAPDEPGLAAFGTQASRVRELAAALGRAPNLEEACHRAARLAVACAGCHAATGITPELSSVPVLPRDAPTLEARMTRHLWATDRLWEGAIGGGDGPWRAGLDVLAASPLPFRTSVDNRAALARDLQRIAATARKQRPDDLAQRGRVYGDILSVCASCHTAPAADQLPSERR